MPEHSLRAYLIVWLALCVLLAATVASAYVELGWMNVAANLGFATLKAGLIGYYFMHLGSAATSIRYAAAVGLLWLGILLALTLADQLSRGG